MTLTPRDRKLVIAIVPLVLLLAYWFLLLHPKREEAGKLGAQLATQQRKRDALNAEVARLTSARKSFATDYATVVKLGKAVPTTVDMPSLIVQLDRSARGTGIAFDRIHAGARTAAANPASSSSSSSSGSGAPSGSAPASQGGSGTPAAAAGGEKAGTGFGRAAEKANETKQSQDAQATSPSGGGAGTSSSSSGAASGSAANGTASNGGAPSSKAPGAPGLDTVPLEFNFTGSFFDLADFFHRLKRFVHVANGRIAVRGRLMTVDGFELKALGFPRLEAQVFATVYLTPKLEGTTGGATPEGPSATPPGAQSASSGSAPPSSTPTSSPPAAVASP